MKGVLNPSCGSIMWQRCLLKQPGVEMLASQLYWLLCYKMIRNGSTGVSLCSGAVSHLFFVLGR